MYMSTHPRHGNSFSKAGTIEKLGGWGLLQKLSLKVEKSWGIEGEGTWVGGGRRSAVPWKCEFKTLRKLAGTFFIVHIFLLFLFSFPFFLFP